ncbi:MAG: hypothetical protein ABI688_00005 [Bacteroidota bacterium]
MLIIIATIIAFWTLLAFWVQLEGPSRFKQFGSPASTQSALIVYDPDPIYNLDQKVCEAFAEGLSARGWKVTVASVRSAKKNSDTPFQLYLFCANTYYWRPDWAICRYIKSHPSISGKNVLALTLGAGSTGSSQKKLEHLLLVQQVNLVDSRTTWLWRPNENTGTHLSNTQSAVNKAWKWAIEIADRFR